MKLLLATLKYQRLVFAVVVVLAGLGFLAWQGMDRQEDPFFPYRYGHILVPYPGAEPEQVERLVLNPLEEELAQVEEINEIRGTARLGLAHVIVGMHQHVYDTDKVWERIRVAVDNAGADFPDATGPIEIADRQMDTHGIVLAVTGSDNLLELRAAAEHLRRQLFRIKDISRIDLLADPGQQVTVTWDDAVAERTGLSARELGGQLGARNLTLPGGSLSVAGRSVVLDPRTEFEDLAELRATPIRTATGDFIPLDELAEIRLEPAEPATERMGFDGAPAVGLGIVIPDNRLNAVTFGETLRAEVEKLRDDYAPLEIREMFFQPKWVEGRLDELGFSLLLGIGMVAAILFAVMGLRLGLTVALIVPVVTFSALAVFAMGGGVLHQMSVAGMVIALGMLVDNAIVMSENIQWHRDRGQPASEAVTESVRELAAPLLAATGTTLAAFMPLLMSSGDTGDFTRAIPIMVMLTLVISYIYAVFVTPVIAARLLKPRKASQRRGLMSLGEKVGHIALARPGRVLLAAAALVVGAAVLSGWLERDFFPSTDRNQLIVDLNFPEGTHIDHTAHAAGALAAALREQRGVNQVFRFAGSSGPRFYYNLMQQPMQPHLARLVAITDHAEDLPRLIEWVRATVPERMPDAEVVARRLGQGPPVQAPIELRVYAENSEVLAEATEKVLGVVRAAPGSRDARDRLGDGLATLKVRIDDARAAAHGISRRDVAAALAGASRGVEVSTWRAGRDPAPILVRSREGERFPAQALSGLQITGAAGETLPLDQIAEIELTWQPAVIHHWDLQRMTSVLAETAEGQTYATVIDQFMPELQALELPEGASVTLGGSAETAGDANTALFRALPVGGLMLLVFLLVQFNSFRMVGIVLTTIPLAAVGVVPGLFLSGMPFSFTAILGVVALVGIVVNNAIVLLDVMNANRAGGMDMDAAIASAVGRRTRPILLTTATTVAGLLPLTFTESTLWPPMAWAIISGLIASTLLTLFVVPALYRVAMRNVVAKRAY